MRDLDYLQSLEGIKGDVLAAEMCASRKDDSLEVTKNLKEALKAIHGIEAYIYKERDGLKIGKHVFKSRLLGTKPFSLAYCFNLANAKIARIKEDKRGEYSSILIDNVKTQMPKSVIAKLKLIVDSIEKAIEEDAKKYVIAKSDKGVAAPQEEE